MSWHAYLVDTMTGRRGARLDIADEGSWTIPLNGIESGTVTVPKAQLRRIAPEWWTPWRASILACWEAADGQEVPWIAGPITQPPSETLTTAELSFSGIGALLERRVVIDGDHTDMLALAKSRVALRDMSLGTIAQEVVRYATEGRLGGHLPIIYATPREVGSGMNERTYEGFNLANNGAFKRLTEITRVRNGPDIAFRPEWADDEQTAIVWAMHNGTRAQPAIAQSWAMDLDATSDSSPIGAVAVATDASALANRVYWTGAGEGAGTLIRMVQSMPQLADGMPLLETVGSTSDSDNPTLLVEHATAALDAGVRHVTQLTATVDGSDPRAEIGRWRVGDSARLTLSDDWLTVPGGTTDKRIIAAEGDWGGGLVDLEFQDDGPIEYEEVTD